MSPSRRAPWARAAAAAQALEEAVARGDLVALFDRTMLLRAVALLLGIGIGSGCNPELEPGVISSGVAASSGSGCDPGVVPPGAPNAPLPTPAAAQAACAQPGEVVDVVDMEGIRAWLPHRWFFCMG